MMRTIRRARESGRGRATASTLAACLAFTLLLGSAQARADDFHVNSRVDAVDVNPGDGHCVTAAATCTLRAAVMEANATSGADAVLLPPGRFGVTIPSSATFETPVDIEIGDVDVTEDLVIRGAGARRSVIDAGGVTRMFTNFVGNVLSIADVTLTGADAMQGSETIALGGALYNQGFATLERVAVVANKASGGGGVFSIPRAQITVRDSLVADNQAIEGGGLRVDSGGEVINSTITGNTLFTTEEAESLGQVVDELVGYGGGIDHRGGDDLTIVSSTIAGNSAIKGGGGLSSGQGYAPISGAAGGRVRLRNTIIAGNRSERGRQNCRNNQVVIESLGHNLDNDGTCFLDKPEDLPERDAMLGPLGDHGGPTDTRVPLTGSPAIDAAGLDGCPSWDQRGLARPAGPACDIGAVEVEVATPAARASCPGRRAIAVRVPARLRSRARTFDVLLGRRVLARGRNARKPARVRIAVRPGRTVTMTLRIMMRDGRVVRVKRRAHGC